MLLILARREDDHIRYMQRHLDARGIVYRHVDPGDFPSRASLTLEYGADGPRRWRAEWEGWDGDLRAVRTVWLRQYSLPKVDESVTEPDYRRAAYELSYACLAGLSDALEARWSPARPREARAAQNKTHQLAVAPSLGLTVPRTTITNDPAAALRFYEECAGRVVTKLSGSIYSVQAPDGRRLMPTHPLRRRDLANFRSLSLAPMILQEYVPKHSELRVIIVARRVFAAEIDSQASVRSRHDWRHYDFDRTAYRAHQLPAAVEQACLRLLSHFGLRYGAIDLILTPSGEYVFLELNPIGQWAFVQDLTGMPIAEALAADLDPASVGDALADISASP